jgi:L-lactate dehydrogenase (cytochrome)
MNLEELRATLQFKPIPRTHRERVLARAYSISDLRTAARKALPRAVFDYVEGGSDEETTLYENRVAFQSRQLHPRTLNDVSSVSLETELFGSVLPAPLGFSPTGYTRMMHPDGEIAVARSAAKNGIPYALSTVGTTTIEEVAATGLNHLWMQIYLLRDRELTWALFDRAYASGVRVLEFSIDTAIGARRLRDLRNGLTIPPSLSPATIIDIGMHPRYWTSMVRAPGMKFANLADPDKPGQTVADINAQFDSSLTWHDLAEIRSRWNGRLLIKGPVSPQDAQRAIDAGADGVHLSNHGGRQLDRCVPAIDLVAPVRAQIGSEPTIVVDSGIRHGMDIAIAIAEGADLATVGRPYLYGLAAAGEAGVDAVYELLTAELRRTLQLLGCTSLTDLRTHGSTLITRRSHD